MGELLMRKSNDQEFTPERVAPLLWAMALMNPEHSRGLLRGPMAIEARRIGGYPQNSVGNAVSHDQALSPYFSVQP